MSHKKFTDFNKSFWNERVPIHKDSEFYKLEQFKTGVNKLHPLEIKELGDIKGKSILHLQCHFGMDTLSLEMLGAKVTGIDFSEVAIKTANELRDEMGMKTEFVLSDIYSLPEKLHKKFDIVFTSYGVLTWLPDIDGWGKVVSHFLKDDGFFYIAEIHPASMIYDNTDKNNKYQIKYPYFGSGDPVYIDEEGTYAEENAKTEHNITYEWPYSLSDIIMSLLKAGLKIEFFHEHDFTVWKQFPWIKLCDDGYYRLDENLPLLFSLKAVKA